LAHLIEALETRTLLDGGYVGRTASGGDWNNDSNWSARTPNSTSAVTIQWRVDQPDGDRGSGDSIGGNGDVLNLFGSLQVFSTATLADLNIAGVR